MNNCELDRLISFLVEDIGELGDIIYVLDFVNKSINQDDSIEDILELMKERRIVIMKLSEKIEQIKNKEKELVQFFKEKELL